MRVGGDAVHPLDGRRIVTTRDRRGVLDQALEDAGAHVVHVPLIVIADAPDGGAALHAALGRLDEFDWVVVTSRHGAERVGPALRSARDRGVAVRVAAVGTATAEVVESHLARPVDLVPGVQHGAALVEAFAAAVPSPATATLSVLVAQADRAEPAVVDGLIGLGHRVEVCTAYSTQLRHPTPGEIEQALGADAILFASGSAATAWGAAVGPVAPPVVCVIGPSTERAALAAGLTVTAAAIDHSVAGLVDCVVDVLVGAP